MKRFIKPSIFVGIIIISVLLNSRFDFLSYLSSMDNIRALSTYVEDRYFLSIIVYILFTVISSSILALPGATFAIISSVLFGVIEGSIFCLIGVTLGAIVSFILSRYCIKDMVKRLVRKNKRLYNILFEIKPEKELLLLMITRLLPIFPFNLQNFAYGVTDISIIKYSIGTFIFTYPGIILFSLATKGIIVAENRVVFLVLLIAVLIFIGFVTYFIYNKYRSIVVEK